MRPLHFIGGIPPRSSHSIYKSVGNWACLLLLLTTYHIYCSFLCCDHFRKATFDISYAGASFIGEELHKPLHTLGFVCITSPSYIAFPISCSFPILFLLSKLQTLQTSQIIIINKKTQTLYYETKPEERHWTKAGLLVLICKE